MAQPRDISRRFGRVLRKKMAKSQIREAAETRSRNRLWKSLFAAKQHDEESLRRAFARLISDREGKRAACLLLAQFSGTSPRRGDLGQRAFSRGRAVGALLLSFREY